MLILSPVWQEELIQKTKLVISQICEIHLENLRN